MARSKTTSSRVCILQKAKKATYQVAFFIGEGLIHFKDCKPKFLSAAVLGFDPHYLGIGFQASERRMLRIDAYTQLIADLE